MIRNIILTIYCIIFCMMLPILKHISILPISGSNDDMSSVHFTVPVIAYENRLPSTVYDKFPYIYKSQHFTCQNTRAGTSSSQQFSDLDSYENQLSFIGNHFDDTCSLCHFTGTTNLNTTYSNKLRSSHIAIQDANLLTGTKSDLLSSNSCSFYFLAGTNVSYVWSS